MRYGCRYADQPAGDGRSVEAADEEAAAQEYARHCDEYCGGFDSDRDVIVRDPATGQESRWTGESEQVTVYTFWPVRPEEKDDERVPGQDARRDGASA